MEKILYLYISTIKDFKNKMICHFNLQENLQWEEIRKQIPVKDILSNGIKYTFHGAGCRIEIKNVICEFDYAPVNNSQVKFDIWKIQEFITSCEIFNESFLIEENLQKEIDNLISKEILSKLKIGDIELDTYQVNQTIYDNPMILL